MKKMLLGFALALGLSGSVLAAGGGFPIEKAPDRTNDMAALQNGAKIFANYCLSCHSAAFMRFNRLRDIGLTDKQIAENLTFTTDKIGDTMKSAIDPRQAKEWFGANPPDLTVIARSRAGHGYSGADYIYTLLRTYYRDETKATGWNNMVFPSIGMPNPLWELQGERKPVMERWKATATRSRCSRAGNRPKPVPCLPRRSTRTWATWWPTCSGWASRPRTPGSASASGCCCSWVSSLWWPGA